MEEITIDKANTRIRHLENQEKFYKAELDRLFEKTQPHGVDYGKLSIQGGLRTNAIEKYVEECDSPKYREYTQNYCDAHNEKLNLVQFVEAELKSSGEYADILAMLVDLKANGYSWSKIEREYIDTFIIKVSLSTCRRIWKSHTGKRCVNEIEQH